MSKVSSILLVLAAAAALVFLVFIEPRIRGPQVTESALREGRIPQIEPAEVRTIRITDRDNILEMHRQGSGWQLGTKSKDRADKAIVERLLHDLAALPFVDRIPAGELTKKDRKIYGLDKPKRTITLEGEDTLTISLGDDAAVENRLYIGTSASEDVYLVGDEVLNNAFRDAGEFRDRRLTDLNPSQLDRVIIRRDDGEIELVQDASGWKITKPLHARADTGKVEKYLNQILGLRILDYVSEDTGDLSVHGLAEGQNEISFFAGGQTRPQTLRLGRNEGESQLGQFTARDSIYRLPGATAELVKVQPDALRDRRLIMLNPDVVDQIRIRSPKGDITLRRKASGWEIKDGATFSPASQEVVHTLWNAVTETEATAYTPVADASLADFGLDPPLCSVEFVAVLSENTAESRAGEQLLAAITLGKAPDGQVYAHLSDSPEISTVPAAILEAIPLDPKNWQTAE